MNATSLSGPEVGDGRKPAYVMVFAVLGDPLSYTQDVGKGTRLQICKVTIYLWGYIENGTVNELQCRFDLVLDVGV